MLRDGWALGPDLVFLNHGAFGAASRSVLEAQDRWRLALEASPVRFLSEELEGHLDRARQRLAAFLGTDAEGLAFVPNATTGVSTVLRSLRFAAGDELLATDHEYNATLNALHRIAARDGAAVRLAAVPFPIGSPGEAVAAILDAVTPRTRLVLLSHVTSPTALLMPVGRISQALAARGIDVLVDGAHAPGNVATEVDRIGATYWTGNGHKWLCGPKGSAVLWIRADRRAQIEPLVISHGWNDPREAGGERSAFRLRFDWTGTSDPTPFLALADALELLAADAPGGWQGIMAANRRLAIEGRDIVAAALDVEPPAPDSMLGAMASLVLPGLASDDDARRLHRELALAGFEVAVIAWPVPAARSPGAGPKAVLLRLSAQRYNDRADYEALARALPAAISRSRS